MTGLARLDGWPVAVLANDPYHYAGGWTADAARKVERFVDLAETFRLPVVHLVDNPGFLIGTAAEEAGTIRHGARALAAIYQATVPWCSVLLRKVYGVAGAAHQNASRFSYRFAWPSGEWGSLPLEGGIEAAYRAQLEAAEDPAALRAEIEARLVARPQPVQDRGGVHDRGDHRPPRHPPAALRVREPRRPPPRPRRRPHGSHRPPLATSRCELVPPGVQSRRTRRCGSEVEAEVGVGAELAVFLVGEREAEALVELRWRRSRSPSSRE